MNLFEILKQFKHIGPYPEFKETSRRAILAVEPTPQWTARLTFLRLIETGVAVALTGFFVLLITGALSGSKIAPVQYSAIDPQSLRAEAQAIDIQIQLASLNYAESSAESTVQIAGVKPGAAPKISPQISGEPSEEIAAGETDTSSPTSVSINEALERLSH